MHSVDMAVSEGEGVSRAQVAGAIGLATPSAPGRYRESRRTRMRGAPVFAAIDLGTNNCRMLVGTPEARGFRVLDSYSRLTRLGEGLHGEGRLGQPAMERTLAALEVCAGRLERTAPRAIRAVATEACRRASNGGDFLREVRARTGLPIDIITTREEAELAVESCAPLLTAASAADGRAILFDIGGGSTEIAWLRVPRASAGADRRAPARPEVIGSVSIPFGVVTLDEAYGGMLDPAGYSRIVDQVMGALGDFERTHCIRREIARGPVRMIGTSGTLTTLATISLGLQHYQRERVDGLVLDAGTTRAATRTLRGLGMAGLREHRCIGPSRANYVLPGCAIFEALQVMWPVGRVTVADRGLRDGMLLRMIRDHASRPAAMGRPHTVVHCRG